RQLGGAHQKGVDATGAAAAFRDRPDDERLAALHITGGEYPGDARHPVLVTPDVAAVGHAHAELVEHAAALGPEKAHRQQHQIGFELELRVRNRPELEAAVLAD